MQRSSLSLVREIRETPTPRLSHSAESSVTLMPASISTAEGTTTNSSRAIRKPSVSRSDNSSSCRHNEPAPYNFPMATSLLSRRLPTDMTRTPGHSSQFGRHLHVR